mmetsp:Transcript_120442/g.286156  ORF Transcript_120442/g.286156 Transcript_120442/m.286156 type:complete len:223 (+) Transcript_120442:686-1354(+)
MPTKTLLFTPVAGKIGQSATEPLAMATKDACARCFFDTMGSTSLMNLPGKSGKSMKCQACFVHSHLGIRVQLFQSWRLRTPKQPIFTARGTSALISPRQTFPLLSTFRTMCDAMLARGTPVADVTMQITMATSIGSKSSETQTVPQQALHMFCAGARAVRRTADWNAVRLCLCTASMIFPSVLTTSACNDSCSTDGVKDQSQQRAKAQLESGFKATSSLIAS